MTNIEFSNEFDILFNNIMSNTAPGLTEYEKSVFLTQAQTDLLKSYFISSSNPNNITLAGNKYNTGYDESAKRQMDFSALTDFDMPIRIDKTDSVVTHLTCVHNTDGAEDFKFVGVLNKRLGELPTNNYVGTDNASGRLTVYTNGIATTKYCNVEIYNYSSNDGTVTFRYKKFDGSTTVTQTNVIIYESRTYVYNKFDDRSTLFIWPSDIMFPVNEIATVGNSRLVNVIPISMDTYSALITKPYKLPAKNQGWRLMIGNTANEGNQPCVELLASGEITSYKIRYVRKPVPIILENLVEGLTIDGCSLESSCELDPIVHREILLRAVELAKAVYMTDQAQQLSFTGAQNNSMKSE